MLVRTGLIATSTENTILKCCNQTEQRYGGIRQVQLLAIFLLNRCGVSLEMTHQEIYQNTDTFKLFSQQRLVGVKGPK